MKQVKIQCIKVRKLKLRKYKNHITYINIYLNILKVTLILILIKYKVRSKINETFVINIFLVAPSVNEVVRWKVICLPDFQ